MKSITQDQLLKRNMIKYVKIFSLIILLILIAGATFFSLPKDVQGNVIFRLFITINIDDRFKNRITVEVPDSYELIQIAFSLTDSYRNDRNLLRKNNPYYEEVEAYFSKYRDHKLITEINRFIKNDLYGKSTVAARIQSLNYTISNENRLIYKSMYTINSVILKYYYSDLFVISENIDLIEDFAQKTNFISFYNNHKGYYSKLIQNYNQLCNFNNMQEWLELKFPNKYQSYRIVFSPLTGGFHCSTNIKDEKKEIEQSLMFVSAPADDLQGLTAKELEIKSGVMSRVVFTEIDHNYANLPDEYNDLLKLAMPDHKFWNSNEADKNYNSRGSTFNEYMTWGVFSLYALDTYSKQNVDTIIQIPANQMIGRGFPRFQEFNNELIAQYKANSRPQITPLFKPILAWMETHYARGRFKGNPVMLQKVNK